MFHFAVVCWILLGKSEVNTVDSSSKFTVRPLGAVRPTSSIHAEVTKGSRVRLDALTVNNRPSSMNIHKFFRTKLF